MLVQGDTSIQLVKLKENSSAVHSNLMFNCVLLTLHELKQV